MSDEPTKATPVVPRDLVRGDSDLVDRHNVIAGRHAQMWRLAEGDADWSERPPKMIHPSVRLGPGNKAIRRGRITTTMPSRTLADREFPVTVTKVDG